LCPKSYQVVLPALKRQLINAVFIIIISFFSNSLGAQDTLSLIDQSSDKIRSDNDSVFSFESNGERIFYRKWGSPVIANNRKILLILHGIGFHSYPYGKITKYIENDSVLVYAIDMPGHGLSGNPRVLSNQIKTS
jgi:hypothetical protein